MAPSLTNRCIVHLCRLWILLLIISNSAFAQWQIEPVVQLNKFSYNAIAEHNGEIWIAYGDSRLYAAHYNNGQWQSGIVDQGKDVGSYLSLALDNQGRPHISYSDQSNGCLKYAYYEENAWVSSVVDAGEKTDDVGFWSSLALDQEGHPHISYYHEGQLRYAANNGAGWLVQVVDNDGFCGKYTSIALNPDGNPSICYWGEYNLRYAQKTGGAWQAETLETLRSEGQSGFNTSLVIDENGHPHIGYMQLIYGPEAFNDKLRYAVHDGNAWVFQTINTTGFFCSAGNPVTLKLDANGLPHIIHKYFYAYFTGGSWAVERFTEKLSSTASLSLDSQDTPHVGFYEGGYRNHYLYYTKKQASGWLEDPSLIAAHTPESDFVNMVLDGSNTPHIVCSNQDNDMAYIRQNGNSWSNEAVPGDSGQHPAIISDSDGKLHISYNDQNGLNDDGIYYGVFDGASWQLEKIFDQYSPGYFHTDLALDDSNHPRIAYTDNLGQLIYTRYDGSQWAGDTIAAKGHTPRIVADSNGNPHICYINFENSNYALYYTRYESGRWQTEKVEDAIYNDFSNKTYCLALDAANQPHLSYITNNNLIYTRKSGDAWQSAVVDSREHRYMKAPSLAISPAGAPHISYYETSDSILKYAWYDGVSWKTGVVDDDGRTGKCSALEIGDDGRPRIAYTRYDGIYYAEFTDSWEPPASPGSLTASALSSHRIQLNWTDNADDEDGFKIEGREDGGEWQQIAAVESNITTFDGIIVSGNTTYQFRVSAYKFLIESLPGNTAEVTTPPAVTPAAFTQASAVITNPYISMNEGQTWLYAGQGIYLGYGRYFRAVGVDTLNGVSCLKVLMMGEGNHPDPDQDPEWSYVWVAEDIEQNIWIFQKYDAEDDELTAFYQDSPILWITASPQSGDIFRYFDYDNYMEVVDTSAVIPKLNTGIGPFSNGLVLQGADKKDIEYYVPGVGYVKNEWSASHWWELQIPNLEKGDVNGDGEVNLEDLILTLTVQAGITTNSLTPLYSLSGADANDNGKIDPAESIFILKKVSGPATGD